MFDLLKGGSKTTRSEEFKSRRQGKWVYYILIPFITLLHILVPHGVGKAAKDEAVGSAVIGLVLLAIAVAWYEVLPRIKRRREQNRLP
jgi:hypothetical protein